MTVCQSVSLPDKTSVLSPLTGTHIFTQQHRGEQRRRPAGTSSVRPQGAADFKDSGKDVCGDINMSIAINEDVYFLSIRLNIRVHLNVLLAMCLL